MTHITATMVGLGLGLATLLTIHILPGLAAVLLLIFAGGILAVVLDAATGAVARVVPGNRAVAYTITLLGILTLVVALGLIVGPRIANETSQLIERIPRAWEQITTRADQYMVIQSIVGKAETPLQWFTENAGVLSLLSGTFGGLFNILIVFIVGIYGAAAPGHYEQIGRHLLPRHKHRDITRLGHNLAAGLRNWLFGRAASMSIVGFAFGSGLWLLGMPLAFSLGLFAGLLSFIPYVGPLLGLVPALMIASIHSLSMAGWVLLLYTGVQALESTVLTPLIQQHTISVPPAVLIAIQLIGGVLVGPIGVLMAAPIMVVIMVTARWLQETSSASDGGNDPPDLHHDHPEPG